jgi:glycosyltransferase involved in cell wall biosynthesis
MLFSVVIATHNRKNFLHECLSSLKTQTYPDFEVIIAHSGAQDGTREISDAWKEKLNLTYIASPEKGAAAQRNYGVNSSSGVWTVFLDDDVILESDFLQEIHNAIIRFPEAAGISARISNQYFEQLSKFKKILLWTIGVGLKNDIAGKIVGPALNFLPQKAGEQFEKLDWMPCVCAYPRELFIKSGGFPSWFKDYSFAEDLFLSLKIRQHGPLILNRNAVLFHNDQGGKGHIDWEKLAYMQMVNRFYILKHALNRNLGWNRIRLLIWYSFGAISGLINGKKKFGAFLSELKGYSKACFAKIP